MKYRSNELELMGDLNLASEELRQNLDELEIINTWLGGYAPILNALQKKWSNKNELITIAHIGSGGGDTLRVIDKWITKKNINGKEWVLMPILL
jgi:hypothetical protein